MSSLHTASECALASLPLQQISADEARVLVGGLGLGYTAHAALQSDRVAYVEVVEFLPQVIGWMRAGLIPLADELSADARLAVTEGDIFRRLQQPPAGEPFDAILIDVDHSPEEVLSGSSHGFYRPEGLRAPSRHMHKDGVFAIWSYDEDTRLRDSMGQTFGRVNVYPVRYYNEHVREGFTDWLYVGQGRRE
jgi:spermidine synthase